LHLCNNNKNIILIIFANLFKNFFIQTEVKGGYASLPSIRTTENKSDKASQDFFYAQYNLAFGYLWSF
jgi:hypothetical protein